MALTKLGHVLIDRDKFDEAVETIERAIVQWRAGEGNDAPGGLASALSDYGVALTRAGRATDAIVALREAVALKEQRPDDRAGIAMAMGNLAQAMQDECQFEEAEDLLERALALDTETFGAGSREVCMRLNNLAALVPETKGWDHADRLLTRALDISEQKYGPDHPHTATARANRANVLLNQGHLELAESEYIKARDGLARSVGTDALLYASTLRGLAEVSDRGGRKLEAIAMLRQAVAIEETSDRKASPELVRDLAALASLLDDPGSALECLKLRRRVVVIAEAVHGRSNWRLARPLVRLAFCLGTWRDVSEQRELSERALEIAKTDSRVDEPTILEALLCLTHALARTGRYEDARPHLARLKDLLGRHTDVPWRHYADYETAMGLVHWGTAEFVQARLHLERALRLHLEAPVAYPEQLATVYDILAKCSGSLGDWPKAMDYLRHAVVLAEKHLGPQDTTTTDFRRRFGSAMSKAWRFGR